MSAESAGRAGGEEPSRRALALARRYARFRARSTAELQAYLQRQRFPQPLIDRVITECVEEGLLDDRACAKLWATHLADRGDAWGAVREQLLAKGLDQELIAEVLASLQARADDATRARDLAQASLARKGLGRRPGADRRLHDRVARLLSQRGFDSELIDRVLAEFFHAQ